MIKQINPDLKALLGDELYAQLETKLKDKDVVIETTEGFIPKARFDQVSADLKDYKAKHESVNAEYEKLKPLAAGNEALTNQIKALQAENEKTKTEYETKITARERDYALSEALRVAKVKNAKAIIGLLDHDKIVLKDGKIDGIEPQLEAIKKTDPYLFDAAPAQKVDAFGKPIVTGGTGGTDADAKAIAAEYLGHAIK